MDNHVKLRHDVKPEDLHAVLVKANQRRSFWALAVLSYRFKIIGNIGVAKMVQISRICNCGKEKKFVD